MTVRIAPPDRRRPVTIAAGTCPQRTACYCCPGAAGGHKNCRLPHPAQVRRCSQPYPVNIPPCREREVLAATPDGRTLPFACCVECGRVTARRWTDPGGRVLPWCAGRFPELTQA